MESNLLNCVIVDDEPLAVEGLKRQLKTFDFLNLAGTFHNAIEASNFIEANKIDLLFLDIKMPQLSGVGMLNALSNRPMVIFTTAYPNHALDAFKLDAVDYLLKPFSFENLLKAINKALLIKKAKTQVPSSEDTFIRSDGSYHRLLFDDILFIEGMKDYIKVHTISEVLTVAMNLSRVMEKLPRDSFIRVHKSYIVNKKKITQFDSYELMLDSVKIPIGSSFREALENEVLSNNVIKK